jgi:hypothetical protein
MYLPDYFESLAKVSEHSGGELVPVQSEYDWNDSEAAAAFSGEQHRAVDAVLETVTAHGARLSALLEQARLPGAGTGPDSGTDELLAMRVQQLFRNIPVLQLAEGRTAVVAIDDGTVLKDERFGGSDLLLIRTSGTAAAVEPKPEPSPPPVPASGRPVALDTHDFDQESA